MDDPTADASTRAPAARRTRLRVLGTVELRDADGRELTAVLTQPRRLALLAYLALARPGAFHRRATLLGLFWPEADEAHARGALRQALHFLRHALGHATLRSRGDDEVSLDGAACWCDAVAFEQTLAAGDAPGAVALYRGELLDGLFVDAAPSFDQWLEQRRARLALAYEAALEQVAVACTDRGELPTAVGWWRTLVERAPTSAQAVLGLMRTLALVGDRAGALRAAREHGARLTRELGAAPDARILALAARLRDEG